MAIVRNYIWLIVILGMIFVSMVISIIFIFINKCISRKGKHSIAQLQKRSGFPAESNKYQERFLENQPCPSTPPLPPRTQFLKAEAQSYENLAEAPEFQQPLPRYEQDTNNYEQPLPDYEQDMNNYEQPLPDYEQDMNNYEEPLPDYEQDMNNYEQPLPDYEQDMNNYEQPLPDYEQNTDQPDYVKVESEEDIFPAPPQYQDLDPTADNASTDDYDDIGEENENHEEDYDDVG